MLLVASGAAQRAEMLRRWLGIPLAILGIVVASAAWTTNSGASPDSRAVLVVDLGNGDVRVHDISFAGEISGLALLEQAGYAPVTRSFGGLGGAVCALTIDAEVRGCPADSTCLLCDNPRFWSYSRDVSRAGAYTVSRYGPSSTVVGDGYVEAWRWGSGATPAYVSFESRFPSSTTTPTASKPTTTVANNPTVGSASSDPATTTTAAKSPTSVTDVDPVVSSTSSNTATTYSASGDGADDLKAASPAGPPVVDEQEGSGTGLIAFAALVAVLLLVIVGVRLRSPKTD